MSQPGNPLTYRQRTILLVDDELILLESMKEVLSRYLENVKVLAAPGGRQGLELLTREGGDIVVSDYKMPEMNGIEFLQRVKERFPGSPRVLITAYPDLEVALKAVEEAAIDNFLPKPFEATHLLEVVGALLLEQRADELRHRALARSLEAQRSRAHVAP